MKGGLRKPRMLYELDKSACAQGAIALQVSFIHNDRALICGSSTGNVYIWQVATAELFQSLPHDGRCTTFWQGNLAYRAVDHVIMAVAVRSAVVQTTLTLNTCRDVRRATYATLLRAPRQWVPVRISRYGVHELVTELACFTVPLTNIIAWSLAGLDVQVARLPLLRRVLRRTKVSRNLFLVAGLMFLSSQTCWGRFWMTCKLPTVSSDLCCYSLHSSGARRTQSTLSHGTSVLIHFRVWCVNCVYLMLWSLDRRSINTVRYAVDRAVPMLVTLRTLSGQCLHIRQINDLLGGVLGDSLGKGNGVAGSRTPPDIMERLPPN